MCIGDLEIWFGNANGQISCILMASSALDISDLKFLDHTLSKYQRIFTKLGMYIGIVKL